MKRLLTIISCILIFSASITAQDYAKKGLWDLGGLILYSNNTIVADGVTQDETVSVFFVDLPVNYFIIDGLSIGVVPEFLSVGVSDGVDITMSAFGIYFSTAYNFNMKGSVYPFIEGRIGYNSININVKEIPELGLAKGNATTQDAVDETLSGIGWGFTGGIKVQIAKGALVNLGVGYQQRTINPENWEGDRNGLNVISVLAGFTVFLGK